MVDGSPTVTTTPPGARPLSRATWIAILILAAAATRAQAIDEEAVNRAIERGKKALLEAITDIAVIEYQGGPGGRNVTVRGRVQSENSSGVIVMTTEGKRVVISKRAIVRWVRAGHVKSEETEPFFGGPTALAVLALLNAEVSTTDPTLSLAIEALANDDTRRMGTYVRSLRACVWSALLERPISKVHRLRYGKLLKDDVTWLTNAMRPHGSWDYTAAAGSRSDNSNGQFAVMGLFAGSLGNVEIARKNWKSIETHWLNTQEPTGSWDYGIDRLPPTASMTVAGCNSLFIVLDRLYARADANYVIFEGARPRKAMRDAMQRVYDAIESGDAYLRKHEPNIIAHRGYELFGLERLGMASGRARIGGIDWFREYADDVAGRTWGESPIGDAFALIFLVHGRAPVLIQKLEHGDASHWNYYHRDMASLVRYWTRTFERLCRWQRIPANADLVEMQDAPMLYISGRGELDLTKATLDTIRAYVDSGGTVILHADLADRRFTTSATSIFEKLFADRALSFAALPPEHAIFRCFYGGPDAAWKRPIRVLGMDDGSRVPVILFPIDIAGAWHQNRDDKLLELFRIMANVRTYAAPPYNELPSRLRTREIASRYGAPWAELKLARFAYDGPWDRHPKVWQQSAESIRRDAGIDVRVSDPVKPGRVIPADLDVLHVAIATEVKLSADARRELKSYVDNGGLLLVDAVDGGPDGGRFVRMFVESLALGPRELLPRNHPIIKGSVKGGRPLSGLTATAAGAGLSAGSGHPPILSVTTGDRVSVIACPFDITAALSGCFIWNRSGYRINDTRQILGNVLAWRAGQRAQGVSE